MKYLIIIEPTGTGYSAYSPDLSGCPSTGTMQGECEKNMHEATEFHIDDLRLEGEPIPAPSSVASFVELT